MRLHFFKEKSGLFINHINKCWHSLSIYLIHHQSVQLVCLHCRRIQSVLFLLIIGIVIIIIIIQIYILKHLRNKVKVVKFNQLQAVIKSSLYWSNISISLRLSMLTKGTKDTSNTRQVKFRSSNNTHQVKMKIIIK